MYRVLQKVFENGMASTYCFVTEVKNRKVVYKEFNSKQEVDEYVEFQLNGGIPKTSLEVVEYIPYTVTADLLENSLYQPAPENVYTLLSAPTAIAQGQPIAFRIDCDFSKFLGVKVNGVPIHNSMYSASAGSTVIEFTSAYCEQLNEGEYIFTFLFEDGIAETAIRVELPSLEEEESPLPPAEEEPETPGEEEETSDPGTVNIEDAELF